MNNKSIRSIEDLSYMLLSSYEGLTAEDKLIPEKASSFILNMLFMLDNEMRNEIKTTIPKEISDTQIMIYSKKIIIKYMLSWAVFVETIAKDENEPIQMINFIHHTGFETFLYSNRTSRKIIKMLFVDEFNRYDMVDKMISDEENINGTK